MNGFFILTLSNTGFSTCKLIKCEVTSGLLASKNSSKLVILQLEKFVNEL